MIQRTKRWLKGYLAFVAEYPIVFVVAFLVGLSVGEWLAGFLR